MQRRGASSRSLASSTEARGPETRAVFWYLQMTRKARVMGVPRGWRPPVSQNQAGEATPRWPPECLPACFTVLTNMPQALSLFETGKALAGARWDSSALFSPAVSKQCAAPWSCQPSSGNEGPVGPLPSLKLLEKSPKTTPTSQRVMQILGGLE